jgi:hypothetical protein
MARKESALCLDCPMPTDAIYEHKGFRVCAIHKEHREKLDKELDSLLRHRASLRLPTILA